MPAYSPENAWPDSRLAAARRAAEAEQARIDQQTVNQQVADELARRESITKEQAAMSSTHLDAIRAQTAANINAGASLKDAEARAFRAYAHMNPDFKIDEATFEGLSATLQTEYASRFNTPTLAADMFLEGPETPAMKRARQVRGEWTEEESAELLAKENARIAAKAEEAVVARRDAAVQAIVNANGVDWETASGMVADLDTFRTPNDKPLTEVQALRESLKNTSRADMGLPEVE